MKTLVALAIYTAIIAGIVGYFMNAIAFLTSDFKSPYKSEVIHGAGIFVVPVGSIAGWFDLGK